MDRLETASIVADTPLDFQRIDAIMDTDEEKASFLKIFFDTAENLLAQLKKAATRREETQWSEAAHSLKGAAGNMGMAALEKLCHDTERACPSEESLRQDHISKIEAELARVKAFIAETHPLLLSKGS